MRKARRMAGLSHSDMAEALGVSEGSVSRFENDLQPPRLAYLLAWAMRCGVPLDWLRYGDSPAASTKWYSPTVALRVAS
jgi:transcriptional regulator with XRE-family HTH domain